MVKVTKSFFGVFFWSCLVCLVVFSKKTIFADVGFGSQRHQRQVG